MSMMMRRTRRRLRTNHQRDRIVEGSGEGIRMEKGNTDTDTNADMTTAADREVGIGNGHTNDRTGRGLEAVIARTSRNRIAAAIAIALALAPGRGLRTVMEERKMEEGIVGEGVMERGTREGGIGTRRGNVPRIAAIVLVDHDRNPVLAHRHQGLKDVGESLREVFEHAHRRGRAPDRDPSHLPESTNHLAQRKEEHALNPDPAHQHPEHDHTRLLLVEERTPSHLLQLAEERNQCHQPFAEIEPRHRQEERMQSRRLPADAANLPMDVTLANNRKDKKTVVPSEGDQMETKMASVVAMGTEVIEVEEAEGEVVAIFEAEEETEVDMEPVGIEFTPEARPTLSPAPVLAMVGSKALNRS